MTCLRFRMSFIKSKRQKQIRQKPKTCVANVKIEHAILNRTIKLTVSTFGRLIYNSQQYYRPSCALPEIERLDNYTHLHYTYLLPFELRYLFSFRNSKSNKIDLLPKQQTLKQTMLKRIHLIFEKFELFYAFQNKNSI